MTMNDTSKGLFGETDRDSGEYRFKNGETHQVYSNAHYAPVGETAVPPKYYRPADKTENEDPAEKKQKARLKKVGLGFFAVLFLCLLCSFIGGAVGFLMTSAYYTKGERMTAQSAPDAAEAVVAEEPEVFAELVSNEEALPEAAEEEPALSAAEIYDLACREVVSIQTDIVNFDSRGNAIPSVVSGSGFAVSEDGYIFTNYHVVEEAVKGGFGVTVTTYSGETYIGSVIAVDESIDAAMVKIDSEVLSPVRLGDSSAILVGDDIYAVGNPYGVLEFTMTSGRISALDRIIATDENADATGMFQIDAAVYSGNSGGPVYDKEGNVIGVVTANFSSSGMEGIGFAIPVNSVINFVSTVTDKNFVINSKAALGIYFDERYTTVYSKFYRLPDGAYVSYVNPGSCAEAAGICSGDIIMQIGEYGVYSYSDVPEALKHYSAGDSAEIILFREGDLYYAGVTFDAAVSDENELPSIDISSHF